jgi:NADH dehydrogenase
MILVAGATGSLGGKIVSGLLEQGESVRCLVRVGSNGERLAASGAEISRGDLREPATLQAACEGVKLVISTASATNRADDTPDHVDDEGNRNLIAAAGKAGSNHLILVSTLGARLDSPVPAFRAKASAEAHLRASGLTYTVLQPNMFMDVWFGMLIEAPVAMDRPVTLVGESRRCHSFIAERDVAAFAIAATRNPAARNTTLVIGGPEAVSFTDAVLAYEQVLGRSIAIQRVEPGQPIPGVPEPVWGIAAASETFDSPIPMTELARQFEIRLTTIRDHAAGSQLVARPVR